MDVVDGVRQVRFAYVNSFVIEADGQVILIDAGPSRSPGRLQRAAGRRPDHVLVTHHHVDHVGPLHALGSESVSVWAHARDAAVIRGDVPPPRPQSRGTVDRIGVGALERLVPKAKHARVDREVEDGELIPVAGGIVAHHTPGHTAGHLSFLLPSKRVLFVGDAAANYLGRLGPPVGIYSEDHAAARASIAKIAALDFDVACFGHGRVLKGGACVAFRKLAEKVAG
jgi:glyoxylase-like metal-dependent hydrolase (beta-lactamase superfamily II)